MKYSDIAVLPLVLTFLHYSSCIVSSLRFRRLNPTSSRFAQTFTTIKGVSLPECAVYGRNEGVLGINYRAESGECELIKRTNDCIEFESGDTTGWQAFRSCDVDNADLSYKSMTQSSEHTNYRPASRAVDDDYDTISHTAQEPVVDQPWWMMELCYEVTITGVRVWNRRGCCKYQLSNVNVTVNGVFCGHLSDPPEPGESKDIMCPGPLTGTFVKIQRLDRSVLNIAEVQLIFTHDGC